MAVKYLPSEAEFYLYALLTDPSGVDLVEFAFVDEKSDDKCFRLYDFQTPWWRDRSKYQADQAGRSVGKSEGIVARACAHPFNFPGQQRLLSAPEFNHLRPIVDLIEHRIKTIWFLRAMCPPNRHMGIARQPQWQVRFLNGAEIRTRLPNLDGRGVKGSHSVVIEIDEAQNYPEPAWAEIVECLVDDPRAEFRIHGVPTGVRGTFWKWTTGLDVNLPWVVHRIMAMQRNTWNDLERKRKIAMYGGSRSYPDYRRNILGEHGDASSPLFVLARLMACVDDDPGSEYNTSIYTPLTITDEDLRDQRVGYEDDDPERPGIEELLDAKVPAIHKIGYSYYYGGGDVGVTQHPSEFLIFGQVEKKVVHRLLLRLHLERVSIEDQVAAIQWLKQFYGRRLVGFGIDRAGVGFGVWQPLADCKIEDGIIAAGSTKEPWVYGWDFSEKIVAELNPDVGEDLDEQMVRRFLVDYASEELRAMVDKKMLQLPSDNELLNQFQGQTWTRGRGGKQDPNKPNKTWSRGNFHALDAAKYFAATKMLPPLHRAIQAQRNVKPERPNVVFPGRWK